MCHCLLQDFVASHAVRLPVVGATAVDHATLRDVAEDLLDALVVPSAFRPDGCKKIFFYRLELLSA